MRSEGNVQADAETGFEARSAWHKAALGRNVIATQAESRAALVPTEQTGQRPWRRAEGLGSEP